MSEFNASPTVPDVENDREFKAHIYQQLVELQPYLAADSQVAVLVQREDDEELTLTLVATWGEYRLEAEGKDEDLYEAFALAKRKMVQQLDEWYNTAIDTTERDAEIQGIMDGSHLIH